MPQQPAAPIEEPLFDSYGGGGAPPTYNLNNLGAAIEDAYAAPAPAPVSSGYDGPPAPPPGQYQATSDVRQLAEDNQSGSVYVQAQQQQQQQQESPKDELYYIYYQEPEGNQVSPSATSAAAPAPQNVDLRNLSFDEPLYYESNPSSKRAATTKDLSARRGGGDGGASSAHFTIAVAGKQHGFSRQTKH